MSISDTSEIDLLWPYLTDAERKELMQLASVLNRPWYPLPGPQTMAYETRASVVGFGGAAGGGKTDLACGKAITRHQRVMVLRRVGTELTAIIDRFEELLGSRDGYNGQEKIWRTSRFDGVPLQIEFGAVPNLGDERKYQGRPHDLLVFDEAANFLEAQVRFLLGWLRSVDPQQLCQALLCFNPPTSAEGRWIIPFFGPWLDPSHPRYPALPGDVHYAAMLPDALGQTRDVWLDRPDRFVLVDGEPVYDFDPNEHPASSIITPLGRTFIPSRITDNPHLFGTGYMSVLQALPEPLRSQMLNGDFRAGMEDDIWQVIPTRWIELAQERWTEPTVLPPMDVMGVDVARGGKDRTTIARRHGSWFNRTLVYAGTQTPDGPSVAGLVMAAKRDQAPIVIDAIGVGSSPLDFLRLNQQQVHAFIANEQSNETDRAGVMRFSNRRSAAWWKFREWLDPNSNTGAALPPEPELLQELATPKWSLKGRVVYVESREEIINRIGRSVDLATAYIMALENIPKVPVRPRSHKSGRTDYNPLDPGSLERLRRV